VQHELSAEEARLTYLLFPHLGSLELDQVEDLGDLVRLVARTRTSLVAGTLAGWPSRLDDYKPYLHQRWNEGRTNIRQLHNEVKALGFRGSYGTVYAYLRPFKGKPAPPTVPAPPKVRHITSWIRRRPGNLDAGEQLKLNEIRAACPHLDALRGHVEEFAKMITGLRGDRLDAWNAAVRTDACPTCTPSPTASNVTTPPS
jgi:hypothetical protein